MADRFTDIKLPPDFKFDDSLAHLLLGKISHGCHPLSQPIPYSYSGFKQDFCLFVPSWLALAKGRLIHFELRQHQNNSQWYWALHFEHQVIIQHLPHESYLDTFRKAEHNLIAQALNEHLLKQLPPKSTSQAFRWCEWSKKSTGSLLFNQPLHSFGESLAALDKFYKVVAHCILSGKADPILDKIVQALKLIRQQSN